jgi:hypothetical protein
MPLPSQTAANSPGPREKVTDSQPSTPTRTATRRQSCQSFSGVLSDRAVLVLLVMPTSRIESCGHHTTMNSALQRSRRHRWRIS